MKPPRSLTNRRDTLIARIAPLQRELDAIEAAIVALTDTAPELPIHEALKKQPRPK